MDPERLSSLNSPDRFWLPTDNPKFTFAVAIRECRGILKHFDTGDEYEYE